MTPRVLRFSRDANIDELRRALWKAHINHQFTQTDEHQVILLMDPARYEDAVGLTQRWFNGEPVQGAHAQPAHVGTARLKARLLEVPLTSALILLCLVVYGLMQLGGAGVFQALAYTALDGNGDSSGGISATLASGQWWRFLTPAVMHFSIAHLGFDLAWVWYFGAQIERRVGVWRLALLVLLAALASNLVQYLSAGPLFGGMSGVVYAYLGYIWLSQHFRPSLHYELPNLLMVLILVWLVLGMTPFMALLGFQDTANQAHLSGLVFGLLAAVVARYWPGKPHSND